MLPGNLILKILHEFDATGFSYVYLRNYENLPEDVGNDVDLLVPKGMREKAARLIRTVLSNSGWSLVRQVEFGPISLFFASTDGKHFMHLDLFDRIEWHWMEYAAPARLIENRQWNGMVHHPAPADEVVLNVMTRLIYGAAVREKHRIQAAAFLDVYGHEPLIAAFEAHMGSRLGPEISGSVANQSWEALIAEVLTIRHNLLIRAFTRHPVSSLLGLARYLRRGTSRLLRPPGPFIVFEGADGVGKSTVMEGTVPMLKGLTGRDNTLIFHWKPSRTSIRIAGESAGAAQNPREHSTRSMPASLMFLVYHWLGFWIGYLRYVLPARAKNRAVLGDRYAYEFSLDPTRLRLNAPQWLLRLASRTVPQPDLVLCLVADPDKILARKQELSEAEIRNYQKALESLASDHDRFTLLQANARIEENIHATCDRIRSCLYPNI
jgi:thymidylate kinase